MLVPIFKDVVNGNLSRINAIVTDTNATMRKIHRLLDATTDFGHVFFTLCDSHGLQLLVKDISALPEWKATFQAISFAVNMFKRSKFQLSRLRDYQLQAYKEHRAFITPVITRWATQLGAAVSIQRSKEALRLYARDTELMSYVRIHQGDKNSVQEEKKTLIKLLTLMRDNAFWDKLDALVTIVKVITDVQHRSEGDKAHVGHVIAGWRSVEAAWVK
jgi:hypothetical protein